MFNHNRFFHISKSSPLSAAQQTLLTNSSRCHGDLSDDTKEISSATLPDVIVKVASERKRQVKEHVTAQQKQQFRGIVQRLKITRSLPKDLNDNKQARDRLPDMIEPVYLIAITNLDTIIEKQREIMNEGLFKNGCRTLTIPLMILMMLILPAVIWKKLDIDVASKVMLVAILMIAAVVTIYRNNKLSSEYFSQKNRLGDANKKMRGEIIYHITVAYERWLEEQQYAPAEINEEQKTMSLMPS